MIDQITRLRLAAELMDQLSPIVMEAQQSVTWARIHVKAMRDYALTMQDAKRTTMAGDMLVSLDLAMIELDSLVEIFEETSGADRVAFRPRLGRAARGGKP